jgi:hypothetical protein
VKANEKVGQTVSKCATCSLSRSLQRRDTRNAREPCASLVVPPRGLWVCVLPRGQFNVNVNGMQGLVLFSVILASPWTSKRVAVHVDSRCTSRLRRADGLSPLTVFDTGCHQGIRGRLQRGGCGVRGDSLRVPRAPGATIACCCCSSMGPRSSWRTISPCRPHCHAPTPSAPSHPSLAFAATSSGALALWRTPVCFGAPRSTVVYRFKIFLGLLEQRLARCSPPSCARSGRARP